MTLHVPIDQFPETVRRVVGSGEAYVSAGDGGSTATAFHPIKRLRVMARLAVSAEELQRVLETQGMEVRLGQWADGEAPHSERVPGTPYVAAVSYHAENGQSGLWVDAYESLPTSTQAIRALYDEFRDTGELDSVSFEEFVRMANPTVVIVSPSELVSFAEAKTVRSPADHG